MLRFLAILSCLVLWGAGPALAQAVAVRTGEHEGFSRVVFDWPAAVPYETQRDPDGNLILTFKSSAPLDLSQAGAKAGSALKGVEILAATGKDAQVLIRMIPGSSYRDFTAGNRVVVDVFGSGEAQAGEKPPAEPSGSPASGHPVQEARAEPAAEPAPHVETTEPPTETIHGAAREPAPAEKPEAGPSHEAESPEPVHEAAHETSVPPSHETASAQSAQGAAHKGITQPHVVTFTTTEATGMAAFERNGYLWLVVDRKDILGNPQIGGPQASEFSPFEAVDVPGAAVWRVPVPEGMELCGEGGGLVWRVVVTPNPRKTAPAELKRIEPDRRMARGSSLAWTLPGARQIIEIRDPDAGDVIKAVTVGGAAEFGGLGRSFVDVDQLRSPIGLALMPRSDGLDIRIEKPDVVVTMPEGLALIRKSDLAGRTMREDHAAPPEEQPAPHDAPGGQHPEGAGEPKEQAQADGHAPERPGEHPAEHGDGHENEHAEEAYTPPPIDPSFKRIFSFDKWRMGGREKLPENQEILMIGLGGKDKTGRVQDLMTLAKLNLANGWGPEALGFLNYAADELPGLDESVEFKALRGAALTLSGRPELALEDLNDPDLSGYDEIGYWKAFALAGLEDWQQAGKVEPGQYGALAAYPSELRSGVGLALAEVALRGGKTDLAEGILLMLARDPDRLPRFEKNAWSYLSGEVNRQRGEEDKALEMWEPLAKDFTDEMYRAKAGFAATDLLYRKKKIPPAEAVDRLEAMRYVWRGDELETRINYRLGQLYIENGDFVKGLLLLREAASLTPESALGRQITDEMAQIFRDIFLTRKYSKDLSALDAISLYEEFPELTPPGADGDRLVERLAETLVKADLLERAAKILQHQIDHRLKGNEAARVAVRLAAIYLLDNHPDKALTMLDRAEKIMEGLPPEQVSLPRQREIKLLRARALSRQDMPGQALDILASLPQDNVVNRLRADIAWQSGQWDEAAEALQDLIQDAAVSPGKPLTPEQTELILNRAVALNLADNRVGLSNIRELYGSAMKPTPRAKMFDVVTRPRQSAVLADRETLSGIVAEVDLFKDFLDSYRSETTVETQ